MKPGRMHRKEGPAGQRGSLFKGADAAGRLPGFIPPGEGGGRRDTSSGSFRVVPATLPLTFLASLARHPSRGHVGFCYEL
jgi:hypothetical protein